MTARNGTRVTMPADAKPPEGSSLKRWSQRKREAARGAPASADPAPAVALVGTPDAKVAPAPVATAPPAPVTATAPALPAIESLTADSDFTVFLQPKVDETLKRQALRKLFADPRFNVMDGLDVYIDDYSKSVPIPPDVLARLVQLRQIVEPPPFPGDRPPESAAGTPVVAAQQTPAAVPAPVAASVITPEVGPDTPPPATVDPAPSAASDDRASGAPDPDAHRPQ